jgi:hypothetical protein
MGIPRQPYRKVHGEQLDEAIRLYNDGMSLRALAKAPRRLAGHAPQPAD